MTKENEDFERAVIIRDGILNILETESRYGTAMAALVEATFLFNHKKYSRELGLDKKVLKYAHESTTSLFNTQYMGWIDILEKMGDIVWEKYEND